jgi:hypothetical protein
MHFQIQQYQHKHHHHFTASTLTPFSMAGVSEKIKSYEYNELYTQNITL